MKKSFLSLILLATTIGVSAQNVGIGTTNPHPSAQLQVSSSTRGFVPPRMSTAQRNAIAQPVGGLIVYDFDLDKLYVYMDGWQPLLDGSMWLRVASPKRQILNLFDSVGIGTLGAAAKLSVAGDVQFSSPEFRLLNGDMKITNGGISMNTSGATLDLQTGGVQKGYVQLSGDNIRLGTYASNGSGRIILRSGGVDRMTVDEDGNIGIGITSPTEKLDVTGNINVSGKLTSNNTGAQNLIPIAWGMTKSAATGGIERGTPNVAVNNVGDGLYEILCPQINGFTVAVMTVRSGPAIIAWRYDAPGRILVFTDIFSNLDGYFVAGNQRFSFVLY